VKREEERGRERKREEERGGERNPIALLLLIGRISRQSFTVRPYDTCEHTHRETVCKKEEEDFTHCVLSSLFSSSPLLFLLLLATRVSTSTLVTTKKRRLSKPSAHTCVCKTIGRERGGRRR
jgi:hypothetical protein